MEWIEDACRNGDLKSVKNLVERFGVPRYMNAFTYAVENGHLEIVKYLIDIHAPRAIVIASSKGHLEIVEYLLKSKLVPALKYATNAAANNKHWSVVDYLLLNGVPYDSSPAIEKRIKKLRKKLEDKFLLFTSSKKLPNEINKEVFKFLMYGKKKSRKKSKFH